MLTQTANLKASGSEVSHKIHNNKISRHTPVTAVAILEPGQELKVKTRITRLLGSSQSKTLGRKNGQGQRRARTSSPLLVHRIGALGRKREAGVEDNL